MTEHDIETVARRTLSRLSDAWHAADGTAYGEPFAEDADFVTVRGERYQGRDAIARGHQAIFDTIYTGSTQAYAAMQARPLAGDVILVHARSDLKAPSGPLDGEHSAVSTLVLVYRDQSWRIAALHNTLVVQSR